MSTRLRSASASVVSVSVSSGAPDGAGEGDRRRRALQRAQEIEGLDDARGPRLRGGIVERDDEIAFGRGLQAPLDDRPGLQIVGERDRAEIVAERRAEPRRRRLHRRDAGRDHDVERAPFRLAPRSPRTPPPPWRRRRDRRRRRPRRRGPPRPATARAARGRARRDCRLHARAGPGRSASRST